MGEEEMEIEAAAAAATEKVTEETEQKNEDEAVVEGNQIFQSAVSHIFNYSYFIILIKTTWQHRFIWTSLAIHPYQLLLLASLLDGIQCLHRTDECMSWCVYVLESIGECCL